MAAATSAGALGIAFKRAPANYYSTSLQQRAAFLGATVPQLCKSMLLENVACRHDRCTDVTDSRLYLVRRRALPPSPQ